MTQEEKAHAYDEALNKAKIEINTKGIGEAVNLCYQLFPQLAESDDEESDDEKTRKALIEVLHRLPASAFDYGAEGGYIGATKEQMLAYLEKQKESLHIPETCKENANSFTDGIIEVRSFQRGMEEGRRLEKQKENPKSSDSIPADCTAGAKCEDRWHKVVDSLPDNPREVLCKDEAGNYFIGRYYVGEGWDISNYDDEDKPHHLNPPVSKWIDFPSEKQKEQKLNIELIQRSWYMEGYRDREFGKEPKWILKTGEGGPKHELNPRYGQPLVEEQKPTEEQLHNLNEAIKGLRMDGCERMADSLHSLYDILLKRNKEQKPNYCPYGGYPNVERCRWCYAACSARLADVHTDEEKEYVRTIKSIISDFIRDKKPENLAYYQRIYDWLDGRHVPFSCGHENGQPADPVFSKQEYESHPIISEDTTSVKPRELDGKTLLYTADKSYQIGFRDGVASVKPEWSEEDEGELQNAIDALEFLGKKGVYKSESGYDAALQAASWLKNFLERFNFQLKPEWSKEDEKDMAHIIRILDDCYAYGKHDLSKTDHENLVNKLKSLRPSWKPSEQEKGALRTAIYVLTEERNFPKAAAQLQNILDAFNGKESRKDWKPSEEQMEALKNSAYGAYQNGDGPALRELYEQLKNL